MRRTRTYYVYIMANEQRTIYIGMMNDLERRVWEHKRPRQDSRSFTHRYGLKKLVYVEEYEHPSDAISREKELKGWKRQRKIGLIMRENPDCRDLASGWVEPTDPR